MARCGSTARHPARRDHNREGRRGHHRRGVRRLGCHLLVRCGRSTDSGRSDRRLSYPSIPPSGLLDFSADGNGTFDAPRYDVRFRINDLFVAERRRSGDRDAPLRGKELSGELDVASPRLAITGTGRIVMTRTADAELTFRFHDSSLDPYVRLFVPRLSPYTTAVASGRFASPGSSPISTASSSMATVDSVDMRLFDYGIRNAAPDASRARSAVVASTISQLVGEDTQLADRRHDRASGRADCAAGGRRREPRNSPGLFPQRPRLRPRRADGRVDGPLREPVFSGSATSPTGASVTFRCRTRSTRSTARSSSIRGASASMTWRATLGGGRIQFGGRSVWTVIFRAI